MSMHRRNRLASLVLLAAVAFLSFSTESPFAEVPAPTEAPAPAKNSFVTKVVGAAAQGAVAAAVAAILSAFTEPIVNRLLVERCTVADAIKAVKLADCAKFFLTTFPTNMLKFPIFEVINMAMTFTDLPSGVRGVVSGLLFCTLMLPVTNYRFRKSMNLPIELGLLYQAYPPTVVRDIVYGWARGLVQTFLSKEFPGYGKEYVGGAVILGVTIWFACIVSAPFNELRGYWLQPPAKKKSFMEFFQPQRFIRSTGVGSTIMGISLMVGNLLVPYAEAAYAYFKEHVMVGILVVTLLVYGYNKVTA